MSYLVTVRSKGNSNFPNPKGQSKYPEMSSAWIQEGFCWLGKSQPSSGTGETGSHVPKGVISLTFCVLAAKLHFKAPTAVSCPPPPPRLLTLLIYNLASLTILSPLSPAGLPSSHR